MCERDSKSAILSIVLLFPSFSAASIVGQDFNSLDVRITLPLRESYTFTVTISELKFG